MSGDDLPNVLGPRGTYIDNTRLRQKSYLPTSIVLGGWRLENKLIIYSQFCIGGFFFFTLNCKPNKEKTKKMKYAFIPEFFGFLGKLFRGKIFDFPILSIF